MPEGPEVLDYYQFIKPILMGNTITEIQVLSGKYLKNSPEHLSDITFPVRVTDVIVKGKTIFISLNSQWWMSFTHGMTGWWDTELDKHSRVQFLVNSDTKLYYNDTRNFGRFTVYTNETAYHEALDALGPDVLDESTTYDIFFSRLLKIKPRSKIGSALLNQHLVSGKLRCDILWLAKIHYTRTIGSLTTHELENLFHAVKTMCVHYLNTDESDPHYTLIYYKDVDMYAYS